jgi:anti-anti-sigma factor
MLSPNSSPDVPRTFTIDLDVLPIDCLVQLSHLAEQATLEVSGEIDIHTVDALVDALAATTGNGIERLVVDLDGVAFIGASGLNALVAAHAAHRDAGKEMRIRTTVPSTLRLISLTGLDELMAPA